MKISLLTVLTVTLFMHNNIFAQDSINLYPEGIPNLKEGIVLGDNTPEFYFYRSKVSRSNKVFLIIPGGGYSRVAMGHEGRDVATKLNEAGYHAFVLRYRLPKSEQFIDKRIVPIQDAQTAIVRLNERLVVEGIKDSEIVVVGFSAGGHLASTVLTHFETNYTDQKVKEGDLKPKYGVLVYPVISMEEGVTHQGSKVNLIGPNFNEDDIKKFSGDLNVSEKTPPTFIVHSEDDKVVPIENAFRFQKALDVHGIPNYLYKYHKGGHGFGLVNKLEPTDWFAKMLDWLEALKK